MSKYPNAPWMELAESYIGTKEIPGGENNPVIIKFYKDAGDPQKSETVAWCAAFVGAIMHRYYDAASQKFVPATLMARSWLNWAAGKKVTTPRFGDIVIFKRGSPPSGHVAFFLSMDDTYVYILGGNQTDAVTKIRYPRSQLLGFRRPPLFAVQGLMDMGSADESDEHEDYEDEDYDPTGEDESEEKHEMSRELFKKPTRKGPGVEEGATAAAGLAAASQTGNWIAGLIVLAVFVGIAAYIYYSKPKTTTKTTKKRGS